MFAISCNSCGRAPGHSSPCYEQLRRQRRRDRTERCPVVIDRPHQHLLEAVPNAEFLALADPDDADHDGISGRANRVRDPRTGVHALGRFGWKASQPSLWLQNATALREDLGVTTPVFPDAPISRARRVQ